MDDIMGQQEVYYYLKKNKKKWFTSKEISKGLKVSIGSVTNCLKKLRKSNAVDFRETKRKNQFEYRL
ncbi:MAG: HTH domain-containing protein [Nanoarchaeota archaeon]